MKKLSLFLLALAMIMFSCKPEIEKPTVVTSSVGEITSSTASVVCQVTEDGGAEVTERGVCWNTEGSPVITDNRTKDGTGVGEFTSIIEGLEAKATYYVRAYATNSEGTSYGEEKTFTTLEGVAVPTVTTKNPGDVTDSSAECGGNVVSDGGADVILRGVCWSTSPNPTISDHRTRDGKGTGSFTSSMEGLEPSTTYYVRAYATNKGGTGYGEEKTFTTMREIDEPTVNTEDVTDVTYNSAVCGGEVTDDGGSAVTSRGVCWSTSQNPMKKDNKTEDGKGKGEFTSNITGLASNTTYYVRAYATNEEGTSYGNTKTFTTESNPNAPVVTTNEASDVTETTAVCGGEVVSSLMSVTARGVCWSTNPSPTIECDRTEEGTGVGSFTSNITDLAPNTQYYVRAYATSSEGTNYGSQVTFTTKEIIVKSMPVVVTDEVSNIGALKAVCGGNVTSDGNAEVISRGVCWSTNPTPTIEDSKTEDGTGIGTYKSNMTGLELSTTYYVRAYATNEIGTSYGEEKTFTTLAEIVMTAPVVTTSEVGEIETTSAVSGGEVIDDGGKEVTVRGICWSTSQNPTISDNKTEDGAGIGSFTSQIPDLAPNTQYYVRAYATNEIGTSYGEEKSFTTKPEIVATLPTVTTAQIGEIDDSYIVCGGNVLSDGNAYVTLRGVCVSIDHNPTIENQRTFDGEGTGSYISYISTSALDGSTKYYVRAYATNEKGTSYGEERSFTTPKKKTKPTVSTANVSDITRESSVCGGEVLSDGNAEVTARGVCWSTSQNPTIYDNKTINGSGVGTFTANITGLNQNTTYYVRAYATNSKGTAYGEEKTFKTLEAKGTSNGHEWIDLGLPSGTKWASCNVGASSPEDYGYYYAWGETTTKSSYTESNSVTYGMTMSDISGNIKYDAARYNWGGQWRMPTNAECEELKNECSCTPETRNGVFGHKITGPNGNSIFLPATGRKYAENNNHAGTVGDYWNSTPSSSSTEKSWQMYTSTNNTLLIADFVRYIGCTIRPVID